MESSLTLLDAGFWIPVWRGWGTKCPDWKKCLKHHPDTIQHPPDTTRSPQTLPRNHPDTPRQPPDTPQTPPRHHLSLPENIQTPLQFNQAAPDPADTPQTPPRQPPDTSQTAPRHLPDTVLCCHHKHYIFLGKVTKFEDVVAIEKFWKSQYENDPGTKCPPPRA